MENISKKKLSFTEINLLFFRIEKLIIKIVSDTRVKGLLFMDSPWPMILILFSYLYFVFQCGPRFMKNRPAYELKSFIKFYNIFQIISNAYLVKEILVVHPDAVALRCMPIDYSNNPDAVRVSFFFLIIIICPNLLII